MFVTLLEGAVVCVGVPYILNLCKNVFGSWIVGKLSLYFTILEAFMISSKQFAASWFKVLVASSVDFNKLYKLHFTSSKLKALIILFPDIKLFQAICDQFYWLWDWL